MNKIMKNTVCVILTIAIVITTPFLNIKSHAAALTTLAIATLSVIAGAVAGSIVTSPAGEDIVSRIAKSCLEDEQYSGEIKGLTLSEAETIIKNNIPLYVKNQSLNLQNIAQQAITNGQEINDLKQFYINSTPKLEFFENGSYQGNYYAALQDSIINASIDELQKMANENKWDIVDNRYSTPFKDYTTSIDNALTKVLQDLGSENVSLESHFTEVGYVRDMIIEKYGLNDVDLHGCTPHFDRFRVTYNEFKTVYYLPVILFDDKIVSVSNTVKNSCYSYLNGYYSIKFGNYIRNYDASLSSGLNGYLDLTVNIQSPAPYRLFYNKLQKSYFNNLLLNGIIINDGTDELNVSLTDCTSFTPLDLSLDPYANKFVIFTGTEKNLTLLMNDIIGKTINGSDIGVEQTTANIGITPIEQAAIQSGIECGVITDTDSANEYNPTITVIPDVSIDESGNVIDNTKTSVKVNENTNVDVQEKVQEMENIKQGYELSIPLPFLNVAFPLYEQCKKLLLALMNYDEANKPPDFSFYYDSNSDGTSEKYNVLDLSMLENTVDNSHMTDKSLIPNGIKYITIIRWVLAACIYGIFVYKLLRALPAYYGGMRGGGGI